MRRDRIPGPVTKLQLRPIEDYSLGSSFTHGMNYTRSTSGSFSRLTSLGFLTSPIIINSIVWDIEYAGTYSLRWVSFPNNTTVIRDFGTIEVSSGGAITFPAPYQPFIFEPGKFYLQLSKSDAAVKWWDYGAAGPQFQGPLVFMYAYYNSTRYSYCAPFRVNGTYLVPYPNSTNFN